jgi:hypothetical protein
VVDAAEDAVRAIEQGMKTTPYSTGHQRGLHGPPAPLNFDDPGLLTAALTQRRQFQSLIRAHDGIAPPSIFNGDAEERVFNGALMSGDPRKVAVAASFASNLLSADPNAFAGVANRKDIEAEATAFRHYVDDLGMTADQAAAKLVQGRDPESQAKVKARIENIDELIKKRLDVSDLRGAFDQSFLGLGRNPQIGFTPDQRGEMFRDYAELTKQFYLDGIGAGDISAAKALAARQLKTTWGVSGVNGSNVVMRYPPERAPRVDQVEDASTLIADDAVASIAAETGAKPDRSKIALMPIAGATAAAYKTGQPVPYMLMWQDADGVPRMLNPGKAFFVDADALLQRQSEARAAKFTKQREVAEADRMIAGEPNRPYGVP